MNPLLELFIKTIEEQCKTHSILTIVEFETGRELIIDLHRKDNNVIYGYQGGIKELLIARLLGKKCFIIHRVFTNNIDNKTNLPIKELCGYSTNNKDGSFYFEKVTNYNLERCCNTDCETGLPMKEEPSVVYL